MIVINPDKIENKFNNFFKKILIITIIVVSIFSYMPITSFAEDDSNNATEDNLYPALVPAFADAIISKFVKTSINTGSEGSSSNGLNAITDNSETGDGWDSTTTVTYPNGVKRTFRNYKQYQGSYAGNYYWGGTIANSACGPSSIAIILTGYGIDVDPGDVVDAFHEMDYDWTSMQRIQTVLKEKYNIDSDREYVSSDSIQHIRDNFNAGRPIISGVVNHFITYLGEDTDGNLILSDPGYSDGRNENTLNSYINKFSGGYEVLLIKSDGNSIQSSSSNNKSNSNSSSSSKKSSTSSSNNGEYSIKDCEVSNGGYDAIFTSGTTGRQYREFKQDANYSYPPIYNGCEWISECGTVATGIIGSGYKNLTMQDIADELNDYGGGTDFCAFLGDFTGQSVQRGSISSVDELVNALANGSVAVIHACAYSGNGHYLAALDISKDKSKIYISNPDIYGGNGIKQGWNSTNDVWDALCAYNPLGKFNHAGKDEIYFVTNDGSTVDYTGEGVSSNKSNGPTEDKIFYIGDSWMVGLNGSGKAKSPSSYFYAEGGKNADWVLNTYSDMKIPNDASCIVVEFGLNGLSSVNWNKTQELVNKLVEDYPEKKIFVLQTPHICDGYTVDPRLNFKIDDYNKHMREYCNNKEGVIFINPTTNIVSGVGNGYLKDEYASNPKDTSQGGGKIHLNSDGYGVWYEDIIKCIKEYIRLDVAQDSIDMSKNIIEREKGNPNNGYKINIDLNAEVDNLLRQLQDRGYHLENYLSSKNQRAYLKNMIKAVIVTQYPDLRNANDIANEKPISDDEVQGCIKIKRYTDGETEAFASGSLKNPKDKNDENEGMYLAYMPYEDFMEKVHNTDIDALNYFTMDSSNNIVVAGWETMDVSVDGPHQTNVGEIQGNVQIGNAPSDYWLDYTPRQQPYTKLTTKNINYLSQVSNYMMPFNLMWSLLVYGHNDKFIDDIARLVISTKIVIGCFDATNVRVTTIPQTYTTNGVAVINFNLTDEQREAVEHATNQAPAPKQKVTYKFEVTETDTLKSDTPSLNVIYADSWTAVYNKEYKLKSETEQEEGETTRLDDEEFGRDTLMKRGDRYVGGREPDNEDLKKKVDETIDSEKDKILDEAILEQQQAADAKNAKISYKYEVLREKLQKTYVGDHLTFMMAEKDVQSHMINMITNKTPRSGIDYVFNTENDLMVKYAKKYGNPNQIIQNTANAIEFLQKDEDFYNELTKNGTDKTQAKVYETNIESITIETKKIKGDQEETVNQEITTVTVEEVPSDGNVRWKKDKDAKENSFVKILSYNSEAKTNLHGVSGWFFESMEHTAAIADLLDLMKMLFQFVYEGSDYGISEEDEKALLDLFDPEKSMKQASSSGTILSGDSIEEQVWNFFVKEGFTDEATAGIMGNLYNESYLDPTCDEPASGGIACFEKSTGNFASMQEYAASKGKDWTDLQCQLEYLLNQLPETFDTYTGLSPYYYGTGEWCWWPEAMTLDEFKQLTDVDKATEIFCRVYERPSIARVERRQGSSREYYDKYHK